MSKDLEDFFKTLEKNNIHYCHWKSIDKLRAAMDGETCIDILIDKKDYLRFNELIYKLGAKKMLPRSWMIFPSTEDFLWLDKSGNTLIHFCVHYQLTLGIKNSKQYVLPLDDLYFKTRIKSSEFDTYIADHELDLIMLIIRFSIKYPPLKLYWLKLIGRKPSEEKEIIWLYQNTDKDKLLKMTKEVDNILKLDSVFFDFFSNINLSKNKLSVLKLKKIKKAIKYYARMTNIKAYLYRFIRKWLSLFSALGRNNGKHFVTGGTSIAFIGCDGSGKTTIANKIIQVLRWKLSAKKYCLGYNKRSYSVVTRFIVLISYSFRLFKVINNKFGKKINIFGNFIAIL